ncbi:Uncharacterised protein [BD1-7 clade bacterium]|uniref:Uncharacterized protein n=1 Tax=BD1-7 clade bacterium TaxID=2029982 RepID=A0A5S9N0L8_9GAMM|nr:Uncharacterised protein [BD1-7 clade bacterium]
MSEQKKPNFVFSIIGIIILIALIYHYTAAYLERQETHVVEGIEQKIDRDMVRDMELPEKKSSDSSASQ